MKNATQYAQKIKRLFGRIKAEAKKDPPVEVADATQTLLLGILSRSAPEKKAAEALTRLMESTVDLNDLRVTSVADLVQIMGTGYPQARPIAEEISQVLISIFNRIHELDLGFLKSLGKKSAAAFVDALDGLSPHANAFFMQRCMQSTTVPLDEAAYEYLIKTDHLPENTSIEDAHKFLKTHVKDADAAIFSAALKVHARSAAGRKEMRGKAVKARASSRTTTRKKKTTAARPTSKRRVTATASRTATKSKRASKKRLRR